MPFKLNGQIMEGITVQYNVNNCYIFFFGWCQAIKSDQGDERINLSCIYAYVVKSSTLNQWNISSVPCYYWAYR